VLGYTLKCTRDPLINRSLLCRNPRILQGDFKLYEYNIDVMEKIALSVKCSFHFNHRIQMNYDMLLFIFLCPSDGDVKSEVPCAGTVTTCAR
jgi:hypothetical protein